MVQKKSKNQEDLTIRFQLKDNYSLMVWDPYIVDPKIKGAGVCSKFFFHVLYSFQRDKGSIFKNHIKDHKELESALNTDFKRIESFFDSEKESLNDIEKKQLFEVEYVEKKSIPVVIDFSQSNSGICPMNAQYLKLFIQFDELVCRLNNFQNFGFISQKYCYKNRKLYQSKIRSLNTKYFNLLKALHEKIKNDENKPNSKS